MKKISSLFIAFVMVLALCVPTFAYDFNGTVLQDDVVLNDGSVIKLYDLYKQLDYPHMWLSVNNSTGAIQLFMVQGEVEVFSDVVSISSDTAKMLSITYNSQQQWVYNQNKTWMNMSEGGGLTNFGQVVWSAQDIFYRDGSLAKAGDPNFPVPPLAEMILEVTEEELVAVTIPEMVGAMKVLVLCGVGLMALLVGLKLFGKRSLIFRS